MTKKTETTKAPTERTDAHGDHSEERVTELAHVDEPAKLTEAQIKDITADDGTESAENTANSDAADHLRDTKAEAKGNDTERSYYHGHGGGAGGPG